MSCGDLSPYAFEEPFGLVKIIIVQICYVNLSLNILEEPLTIHFPNSANNELQRCYMDLSLNILVLPSSISLNGANYECTKMLYGLVTLSCCTIYLSQ